MIPPEEAAKLRALVTDPEVLAQLWALVQAIGATGGRGTVSLAFHLFPGKPVSVSVSLEATPRALTGRGQEA